MTINMENVFQIHQSSLPSGYTQLEYIESTGTQYIDTGYVWTTDNAIVETEIYRTEDVSAGHGIYGSQKSTTHGLTLYKIGSASASNYSAYFGSPVISATLPLQEWIGIKQEKQGSNLLIKVGETTQTSTGSIALEKTNSIYLFSSHYNTGTDGYAKIRCKYFKVIDNNTLVRNLIPAKRNSDNIVGMYDLVSNTFFTNAGTGSFVAGSAVEVTKISQNNNIIWERAIPLTSNKAENISFRSTRNAGKNLFDKSKSWQIGSTYSNYQYQTSNTQCYIKLFDNDISVDLSGIYFGIKHELTSSSSGVWFVTGGSVVLTGATNIVNNEYSNYLITFPNDQATVDKVLQRFKIMIVKGSTAPTSYQPYWNTLPELNAYGGTEKRKRPELWSRYLPIQTLVPATYPMKKENLFDNVMEDGNIGNDGKDAGTNSSYYRSKNYTEVKPNTTYQFSFNSTIDSGQFYIIEYDKDKNFISRVAYNDFIRESRPAGYTSSANTKFIRFFIYSGTTTPHDVITWVQIEEGSIVTSYIPYGQKLIAVQDIGLDGTKTGTYGYFNTTTNEFTQVSGMTGSALELIDHIEATGEQYILPNLTGNVEWKLVAQGEKQLGTQALVCSSQTCADGTYVGEFGSYGKWGIGDEIPSTIDIETKATIDINFTSSSQYGTINGESVTHTTSAVHNTWALMGTSTGDYCFNGKLFSAQAIQNNVIVRDYVPIKAGAVYCLLDKVNWEIVGSASGTGFNGSSAVIIPDDIVSNNGVIKYGVGKNLVQTWYTNRSRTSAAGVLYSVDRFYVSDIFPIDHTKDYTLSHNGTKITSLRAYYYSSSSEAGYIGWENNVSTLTIPANATHMAIGCGGDATVSSGIEDYVKLCQVEEGSTATPYEPYFFGLYTKGTQEKITVSGKNLFDKNKENIVITGFVSNSGGFSPSSSVITDYTKNKTMASVMYPIKGGKTYTITRADGSFRTSAAFRVLFTTGNPTVAENIVGSELSESTILQSLTVNVPESATYLVIYIMHSGDDTYTIQDRLDIMQIEEGSTATSYEPYHAPQTALAEMLSKVSDYEDVQNIVSGKVTKNVGVKVLDGTENWTYLSDLSVFRINISDYKASDLDTVSTSTHFVGKNARTGYSVLDNRQFKFDSTTCNIKYTAYTTVETFKAYLASEYAKGTPVIVAYPLATSTTSTVPAQEININKGTYKAEVTEASLSGLDISVKYLGND